MSPSRSTILAAALAAGLGPGPGAAQRLDVPFDTLCPSDSEAACFGAATVMGLDPNGDGFLAVRSGPGSDYARIGEVHDGDRVGTYGRRGAWHAISFGRDDRLGWAHGNWLGDHVP